MEGKKKKTNTKKKKKINPQNPIQHEEEQRQDVKFFLGLFSKLS